MLGLSDGPSVPTSLLMESLFKLNLRPEAADRFWPLFRSIGETNLADMRQKLRAFVAVSEDHIKKSENDLVASQIRHLVTEANSLLDLCESEPDAEFVPYVLAAVEYLVLLDDAENDFESIFGFCDDAAILVEVMRAFNLEERIAFTVNSQKARKSA